MTDCEVCRGRQIIRLPLYRKLRAVAEASFETTVSVNKDSREFPCPECSPSVDNSRVVALHAEVRAIREYAREPDFQDHARKDIARRLADLMLDLDLVRFGEWKDRDDRTAVMRGTAGVVAPNVVAEMEQRIAERQAEKAEEAAQHLLKQVSNWGSDFGADTIGKDVLRQFIREAVESVR